MSGYDFSQDEANELLETADERIEVLETALRAIQQINVLGSESRRIAVTALTPSAKESQ